MLSPSLLLVEDDKALASLVEQYLEQRGFRVNLAFSGYEALEVFSRCQPDLVILDIGLPGLDGLEVCKKLRSHYSGPIIILTALDEEADEVLGLEVGADDYLCKPVRPRILLARVRALLRRNSVVTSIAHVIEISGIRVDSGTREVSVQGIAVKLTTAEFDLLLVLAQNAGKVLSREKLSGDVRGIEHDTFDRSIDLRISRLRKKLGDDPRKPTIIKSVRGVGYLLAASS